MLFDRCEKETTFKHMEDNFNFTNILCTLVTVTVTLWVTTVN